MRGEEETGGCRESQWPGSRGGIKSHQTTRHAAEEVPRTLPDLLRSWQPKEAYGYKAEDGNDVTKNPRGVRRAAVKDWDGFKA